MPAVYGGGEGTRAQDETKQSISVKQQLWHIQYLYLFLQFSLSKTP